MLHTICLLSTYNLLKLQFIGDNAGHKWLQLNDNQVQIQKEPAATK